MALKTHWVYIAMKKKKIKPNSKQTGSAPQGPNHAGTDRLSTVWSHSGHKGGLGSPVTGMCFLGTPLETANQLAWRQVG